MNGAGVNFEEHLRGRLQKTHDLKTWPEFFEAVERGFKKHEVRVADRDFQPGDLLVLLEYVPNVGYTGRSLLRQITYITAPGSWGLPENVCVLSLGEVGK